jgi:PAS domain S-box-containing protein
MEPDSSAVVRLPTVQLAGLKLRLGLAEESEELFRALTAQAPVGVFVTATDGECVYANERTCSLTGLTGEQMLGFGWTAALHHADAERVTAEWRRASEAGEDFTLEYRFQHPDGTVVWVEGTASSVLDRRGALVGRVGILLDLTARRLSEERYRSMFENALDPVYVADPAGNFTSVNEAAQRLTGFSGAELLAMNFFDLVAPGDAPLVRRILARQLAGGGDEIIEVRVVTKSGDEVSVEVSSHLVLDDGQPVRLEGIA